MKLKFESDNPYAKFVIEKDTKYQNFSNNHLVVEWKRTGGLKCNERSKLLDIVVK